MQVMRDSALVVRRPGECQYFVDPGCEVAADTVTFTPEITAVRLVSPCGILRGLHGFVARLAPLFFV